MPNERADPKGDGKDGSPASGHERRFREEALNVRLGDVLHRQGLIALPEQIRRSLAHGTGLPDVVIGSIHGLRIIIEGKVGDAPDAIGRVERDAKKRIEEGLAALALAVVYPPALRAAQIDDQESAYRAFAESTLRIRVFSEESDGEWVQGGLDTLAAILRRAYENLAREDLVDAAVREIGIALDQVETLSILRDGTGSRLHEVLGIGQAKVVEAQEEEGEEIDT